MELENTSLEKMSRILFLVCFINNQCFFEQSTE